MAGAQSVQGLVEFIRTLGAARLGAMAAVTAALIGMFGFIILRVTAAQMFPVFTDLTPDDSAAIVKDLERQGIAYELKNDGAIVMVPRDKMTRIRMKLAEGGLPKGGGVGYEIFDKSDTLGATSFVQNINHLRALEGELARTIKAIDRVQVSAEVDFNRITETSDKFDPEGRVVRSSQTREESSAGGLLQEGPVSVGNELPGGQQAAQGQAPNTQAARDAAKKSEEIVNY